MQEKLYQSSAGRDKVSTGRRSAQLFLDDRGEKKPSVTLAWLAAMIFGPL
jgi:hypothetical protein